MISKVISFTERFLEERNDLFLLQAKELNKGFFQIIIDGDTGVKLADCINLNRALKKEFNTQKLEDSVGFEVSTPDITAAILVQRQYRKNIGRKLKIKTEEGDFEGYLQKVTIEGIEIEWEQREPKPIGKGKNNNHKETIFKL